MIAEFETALPTFNATVTSSTIIARSTPPLPMPAPEGKGFWRIKADWSKDSDNDGIRDHTEYAVAASAQQGGQSGGGGTGGSPAFPDPLDGDTNGNGTPDGKELDSDGDGTPDSFDISPTESAVGFDKVALPRYAMFVFDGSAFQINDRGTALFTEKVWKNGSLINLNVTSPVVDSITAYAINTHDQIIGQGLTYVPIGEDSDEAFTALCYWSSPVAAPVRVQTDEGGGNIRYAQQTFNIETSPSAPGSKFSDDGDFFSGSEILPSFTGKGARKWNLGSGANPTLSSVSSNENLTDIVDANLNWGHTLDEQDDYLSGILNIPAQTSPPPFIPNNFVRHVLENDKTTIVATPKAINGRTKVLLDGVWEESPTLAHAIDLAKDGKAIGKAHVGPTGVTTGANPFLLNGRWTALERVAPDMPEAWKDSATLHDSSQAGWVLANHFALGKSAALLPIRAEGSFVNSAQQSVTRAVGVDDFSIGRVDGPSADPPVTVDHNDERIWIMAPLGGPEKSVKFTLPAHQSAPVKLTATEILFGGQAEAICTTHETVLTVKAGPGATSGEEKLMDITMGTAQSVSKPIGFKIMKRREVKVAVWIVRSDRNPPGMLPTDPEYQNIVDTDFNPTEAELNNYLNNVFDPQINAVFDCKVNHIDVRFDTATGTAFGAPAEDVKAPNWTLDTDLALGKEFDPIRLAGYDDTKSINLYIVSANFIGINTWLPHSNYLHRSINWGKASRTQRIVVVAGGWPRTSFGYFDTVAHEIGHILIGPGHPDENTGPAPLPGTRDIERLMCSGGKKRLEGHLSLLVKKEWHEADLWLTGEENDGRIGP